MSGTPFSPEDVTVFSNCDSVRLSVNGGAPVEKKVGSYPTASSACPSSSRSLGFMENKNLPAGGKEGAVKAGGGRPDWREGGDQA